MINAFKPFQNLLFTSVLSPTCNSIRGVNMGKINKKEIVHNGLLDQLEEYLSETVPYVAQNIQTVCTQHPRKTFNQASSYVSATVPPKMETVKKYIKSTYEQATEENIKKKAKQGKDLLLNGVQFVKDHRFTVGTGVGLFALGLYAPTTSLTLGAAAVAKTVYDNGGMDIGFDNMQGKASVKVRIGARKPK